MKLHYQTVSPVLLECLHRLMSHPDWGIQSYPWSVTPEAVKDAFNRLPMITDFTEVVCLKGKYWEFVVEDLLDAARLI